MRKDLADFAGTDGDSGFDFEHAAGGRLAGNEARQKAEARAQDAVEGAVVERLEQPGGGQRMEFLHGPEGIVGDAGVGIGEAVFEVGNAVGAGECGGGGLCQGTWLHIPHRVTTQPGTGAPSRRGVRCARNRGFAPTVTGWSAFQAHGAVILVSQDEIKKWIQTGERSEPKSLPNGEGAAIAAGGAKCPAAE